MTPISHTFLGYYINLQQNLSYFNKMTQQFVYRQDMRVQLMSHLPIIVSPLKK